MTAIVDRNIDALVKRRRKDHENTGVFADGLVTYAAIGAGTTGINRRDRKL